MDNSKNGNKREKRRSTGSIAPSPQLPQELTVVPGEYVVVRCAQFQCLAYLDPAGKWRAAHGGAELPEVLEIISRI